MRLLQIRVPDDRRETLLDVLRERDLGYSVTDGAADQADESIVFFVVPADAVEYVLDDLVEAGFDRDEYTVSLSAEFASFEGVDEVQNRWAKSPNRIAPATLRSKAKDLRLNTRSYVWMMVLSAVVATAGLLVGSPAVVVGSMVIAPIVSPSLTANVGLVRNDRDMVIDSIHMQGYGLGVAVLTSVGFSFLVKWLEVVPVGLAVSRLELVSPRVSPSILAIAVGLVAGAAGAYGLATKGQVTIVGVMIAAALIPTAGAVGIGVAWGSYIIAAGALLLLVLSVLAINVGGTAMLLYLDYRPDDVDESLFAFDDARQALVVVATVLVVLAVAVGTGVAFYDQSSFERDVNTAVTDVVNSPEYQGVGVESVSIEYDAPPVVPGSDRPTVTVHLVRTADGEFPELPTAIDRRITDRTGEEVLVQVRYTEYHRSESVSGTVGAATPGADRNGASSLASAARHGATGRPAHV